MDGRIHVAEGAFVSGQLAIWVHVLHGRNFELTFLSNTRASIRQT
jgi:hypothetical protein